MHELSNDFGICTTVLLYENRKLVLGRWKVLREIEFELAIGPKWCVCTSRVFCSCWSEEPINNGVFDVLGLVEGYAMLRSDDSQVEIFEFGALLGSYIEVLFQVGYQAGVGFGVGICTEEIIS